MPRSGQLRIASLLISSAINSKVGAICRNSKYADYIAIKQWSHVSRLLSTLCVHHSHQRWHHCSVAAWQIFNGATKDDTNNHFHQLASTTTIFLVCILSNITNKSINTFKLLHKSLLCKLYKNFGKDGRYYVCVTQPWKCCMLGDDLMYLCCMHHFPFHVFFGFPANPLVSNIIRN